MMERGELEPGLYEGIKKSCAVGDALAAKHEYRQAIVEYNKAWQLLPEPRDNWQASTWILAAIGDAAYLGGFRELAQRAFDDVMFCPNALGNAFVHLRRGQLLFDDSKLDAAADELIRAYMAEGEAAFIHEDAKYLNFLRERAEI